MPSMVTSAPYRQRRTSFEFNQSARSRCGDWEGNDVAALSVGDGTVSIVLFAPWFVGMFLLVGYLVSKKERYHLA